MKAACPVTPQELREIAQWIENAKPVSMKTWYGDLRKLAEWLEAEPRPQSEALNRLAEQVLKPRVDEGAPRVRISREQLVELVNLWDSTEWEPEKFAVLVEAKLREIVPGLEVTDVA